MKILFCNIAWMDYYKGIKETDEPIGGGKYVTDHHDAHEIYNFTSAKLSFENNFLPDGEYCLGFVETKATSGDKSNQLHIEKIIDCDASMSDDYVEDVLVVYCAAHPSQGFTTVVGWYRHAIVYRNYMRAGFPQEDDGIYEQFYNAIAETKNCVLLPRSERSKILKWKVPRRKTGISYGFGRANIWFATEAESNTYLRKYLEELEERIENYDGENWIDRYPD